MNQPCKVHGTWVCHGCSNFRRNNAIRKFKQVCAKCGSNQGEFKDIHHRSETSCNSDLIRQGFIPSKLLG